MTRSEVTEMNLCWSNENQISNGHERLEGRKMNQGILDSGCNSLNAFHVNLVSIQIPSLSVKLFITRYEL